MRADLSKTIARYIFMEQTKKLLIPSIGFGTYKAAIQDGAQVIREALDAGYRYFDTASFYENEDVVGSVLAGSGLSRKSYFVASKIWKSDLGYDSAKEAIARSLDRLGLDYMDVCLIHWPKSSPDDTRWEERLAGTWKAMEEACSQGKIRTLGVSNFLPHHLKVILDCASIRPAIDQIEFHPGYLQEETLEECRRQGILVQAWSPMGRARVLQDPLLTNLAAQYGVSTAQLCLKFALQMGVMPLPKSVSPDRMRQNLALDGFVIADDDMEKIKAMPCTGWSGEHPDRERVPAQN